jgi:hypothetical protein
VDLLLPSGGTASDAGAKSANFLFDSLGTQVRTLSVKITSNALPIKSPRLATKAAKCAHKNRLIRFCGQPQTKPIKAINVCGESPTHYPRKLRPSKKTKVPLCSKQRNNFQIN